VKKKIAYSYRPELKQIARNLRKNMTPAEIKLWQKIRRKQLKGIRFYRQRPIGNYIVDFCSFSPRLIIEVDGDTHYTDEAKQRDMKRDRFFQSMGFKILRFTNKDIIQNIDGVIETITKILDEMH
jgi:very-short-patch-repair endonuclease